MKKIRKIITKITKIKMNIRPPNMINKRKNKGININAVILCFMLISFIMHCNVKGSHVDIVCLNY